MPMMAPLHTPLGGGDRGRRPTTDCLHAVAVAGGGAMMTATLAGGLAEAGGWGSIIGTHAGTIVLEASGEDQSLDRTFRTTNDKEMPASAHGLAAGAVAVAVSEGAKEAADISNKEDFLDDGNGNNGGNDDNAGDDVNRAINSPDTAATANNDDDDDEGMWRKTLVTAMIQRKTYTTHADILEGGASSRPLEPDLSFSPTQKWLLLRLLNLGMSPKAATL
jgi:hypothetical protein